MNTPSLSKISAPCAPIFINKHRLTLTMRTILILLLIILLLPSLNWGQAAADEMKPPSNILAKNGVIVVPDLMLRGYDPITVFFPGDRGPAQGGPLDQPGQLFRLTPTHPGEYKWSDARTLQFLPTIPWPALERYTIQIEGKEFQLVTLMDPPQEISPTNTQDNLDPVSEITLSFNSPIEPSRLASMITLEIRPLPGVETGKSYWLTARDFDIKELERTAQYAPARYRVSLHKPVSYGKKIILHLRLSTDNRIKGSLARYTFSTKPLFRLFKVGNYDNYYPISSNGSVYTREQALDLGLGASEIILFFNDNLGPVSIQQVKEMVRFEPAVRNLQVEVSSNIIYLRFDADRDKTYKLSLHHINLQNSAGRDLTPFGPSSLYFFFRPAYPYLKWLAGQGILERQGPQVFPMEGRNMEQVDLRIYKLNPFNRNTWPFPGSPVQINESNRPAGPGEEPEYATSLQEQILLLGSPLVSQVLPLPIKTGTSMRFGLELSSHFARASGAEQPGHYLVGYRTIGQDTQRSYVRVQVTDLCLSAIEEESAVTFFVTSLKTGLPISGATVAIEYVLEEQWYTFAKGETNTTGMFRVKAAETDFSRVSRISVTHGNDVLVLDPEKAPPFFMNNHWYNSYENWLDWLLGPIRSFKTDFYRKAHILTERPIYRPEEEVHIKGYIRVREQGRILPDRSPVKYILRVFGPGEKQWTFPVQLNPFGSFYQKFAAPDLPTGEYTAAIKEEITDSTLAQVTFKKESYRIPSFEIKLSAPDRVALDEPFAVDLNAVYYAGGPVVGQEVTWQVTPAPYYYNLPGYPGFLFSSNERFSGGAPREDYGVTSKSDVTDDTGAAKITIDPSKEDDGRSLRYVIEATVRGADEQTVTSTRQVLALSPFVLGVKLERFLKKDMIIKPEIIVVGHDDKPLAGKEYHVKLMQRQWHSHLQESDFTTGKARYITDVVDETIFEKDEVSGPTAKTLSLPVKESGVYVVEISARDKQGRLQKVVVDLYVAGDTPVSWKKPEANIFDSTADKNDYNPGDVAKVIIKSPFQEANTLVIVEGPAANIYHWLPVKNGQAVFQLPITGDMNPHVIVHFILMRGRLPGELKRIEEGKEDRAKPITMGNTVWLKVNPRDNMLNLALEHEKVHLPGSKAEIRIKMTDMAGKPLDGEVTLWLVDRAVLALGKEKPLDPLPSFIDPVRSWIRVRDTRNLVVGNLSQEEIPGGDGAEELEEGSIFSKVTVRKNFKTVPYFNPTIQVKNGEARIQVELPDNLTDFAVRAVATDFSQTRFGFARSMISVRLPVIVQPALPRFVRPGDQFVAGGIGRIVEGEGGPGKAELQVTGLQITGNDKYAFQWTKGKAEQVYFPLVVPGDAFVKKEKEVVVRLTVKRDEDSAMDAFEIKLPIRPDTLTRRLEKFVTLEPGKHYEFPKPIEPPRAGTMKQELAITTEPALVKMLAALNYLANYPHGCTEQRISKLMPELMLKHVMKMIGREIHTNELKNMMDETFIFLESVQGSNGLFSYWPGSQGYVNLTAYVVEFLVEAKKQGFSYKPQLLDRAVTALKESLHTDYRNFIDGESYFERVEAMAALAKTGYFDDAYAHDLFARSLNMNLYSEARILYMFLNQPSPYQKAVDQLGSDLNKSLIFKLRDGQEVYGGLQYRQSNWGGLILSSESRTLAGVTRSLFKLEPANERVRVLINELVSLGSADGWGSTCANAAALMTLGDVLAQKQPQTTRCEVETVFGNDKQTVDTQDKCFVTTENRGETTGSIRLVKGDKAKPPLVWLSLSYIPAGNGDQVKRQSDGFLVSRELLIYKNESDPPVRVPAEAGKSLELEMGTIVEEHIQVINAEDRFYVAIQAPFAAGFEPLNPNLATAPREARPAGTFTRQPDYSLYADDAVTFYFDQLPRGTYDFYFRIRSSVEGNFTHPPAIAELMYQLTVRGNSDGMRIIIKGRKE